MNLGRRAASLTEGLNWCVIIVPNSAMVTAKRPAGTMTESCLLKIMISDLVPNGMLPLSAALGALGAPPAVGLALLLATAFSSWWTLGLLVNLHDMHPEGAHRLLGHRGERAVEAMVAGLCFWNCVAYVDFSLDLMGPALAYPASFGRALACTAMVWGVLYPLCSLPDLSQLQPFSTFAVVASAAVAALVLLRSADGSYAPGGAFLPQENVVAAAAAAAVGTGEADVMLQQHPADTAAAAVAVTTGVVATPLEPLWWCGAWLLGLLRCVVRAAQFVAVLCVGFLSHYNAEAYYFALADTSPRRFGRVSGLAFACTAVCYAVVMVGGYAIFGAGSHTTLLRSFAPADKLASLGRLGLSLSLLTSFPLMFSGLRKAFFLALREEQRSGGGGGGGGDGGIPGPAGGSSMVGSLDWAPPLSPQRPTGPSSHSPRFPAVAAESEAAPLVEPPAARPPATDGFCPAPLPTVLLLAGVHVAALLLPDVRPVVGATGAVFGAGAIYGLPGLVALAHERRLDSSRHDRQHNDSDSDLIAAALGGGSGGGRGGGGVGGGGGSVVGIGGGGSGGSGGRILSAGLGGLGGDGGGVVTSLVGAVVSGGWGEAAWPDKALARVGSERKGHLAAAAATQPFWLLLGAAATLAVAGFPWASMGR